MMFNDSFFNKLRELGLNTYESKVWCALLSKGLATASELSELSEVPRSRTYDVLESLEKKGFVIMKLGKPIKYLSLPPETVIENVKNRIKEDSERKVNSIDQLKTSELLNNLMLLHNKGVEMLDPGEFSGSLRGRDNIYNYLNQLIKGSEKCIKISTSESGLLRKLNILNNSLKRARSNNIEVKIMSPLRNSSLKNELLKLFSLKTSVKNNSRFVIIDDNHLVFMLNDDGVDSSLDSAIWVKTPYFVGYFSYLFDENWKKLK